MSGRLGVVSIFAQRAGLPLIAFRVTSVHGGIATICNAVDRVEKDTDEEVGFCVNYWKN